MSVCICDKDTLAVFDKFLPGLYGSHKILYFTFIIYVIKFLIKLPALHENWIREMNQSELVN